MKNRPQALRVGLLVTVAFTFFAGAVLAQKAPAAKAPAASASGQASGTFAVGGKTYKLSHAAAFVDQKDERKPTVIVITDDEVPAATWTSDQPRTSPSLRRRLPSAPSRPPRASAPASAERRSAMEAAPVGVDEVRRHDARPDIFALERKGRDDLLAGMA